MALTDAYASVPEYRLWKGKTASDDEIVLGWCLEAMSRVIDLKLNQPYGFNIDAAPTVRVYAPGDPIAPIASLDGLFVKVAAGTSADFGSVTPLVRGTDYELRPRNPRLGWPYTSVYFFDYTPVGALINPSTYRNSAYRAEITAIHGWPEVPKAIKWAVVEMVSMLGGESIFTTGRINNLESVVEASAQARALLNDLQRQYNPYPVGIG